MILSTHNDDGILLQIQILVNKGEKWQQCLNQFWIYQQTTRLMQIAKNGMKILLVGKNSKGKWNKQYWLTT